MKSVDKNSQKSEIAGFYRDALLNDVIPFWQRYSPDKKSGGYFTCLDRDGRVYDTDKFVWLQARQAWTFSMLFNRVEPRDKWLEFAKNGIDFLKEHGHDRGGNWFFSLTREGKPLVQPYNIFSDCFAAMAFSQYSLAANDEQAKDIAENTFQNILKRRNNPKGKYNKLAPETRPMMSLSLPMILANLTTEMSWMLGKSIVEETIDSCLNSLFDMFIHKEKQILLEAVSPAGQFVDSFEGRLINPGHGIEAMAFVIDIAEQREDPAMINKATDLILKTLEFGWDKKYDGIFYFLDILGNPGQQLEWNQKLWWVHLETLVALAMSWRLTGRDNCKAWYWRVHEYAWKNFPDPKYGEWFGYLDRSGEKISSAKGGKWKGCFHVPRGLYQCMKQFNQMTTED